MLLRCAPMKMRKEHTSTKRLCCVLGWWAEALPPCVYYIP
jgi:hypothetical protein